MLEGAKDRGCLTGDGVGVEVEVGLVEELVRIEHRTYCK